MEDKQYWDLSEEDRKEQDIIEAHATEPSFRYYLWDYCRSYGWRQMGNSCGYESLEELKKEHTYRFNKERGTIQKILKAKILD